MQHLQRNHKAVVRQWLGCAGMGLALGGGIGYLLRPHGLTADNIINATLVLANGSQVHLSKASVYAFLKSPTSDQQHCL